MTTHDRRIVALFCAVFLVGTGWVAQASGSREVRHSRVVESVCSHPMHWEREHGVTIVYEGCE